MGEGEYWAPGLLSDTLFVTSIFYHLLNLLLYLILIYINNLVLLYIYIYIFIYIYIYIKVGYCLPPQIIFPYVNIHYR